MGSSLKGLVTATTVSDLCRKEGGYAMTVQVVQARDLKAVDNLKGKDGGSSDPFVVLTMEGQKEQKTKVIKKELNPTWEESFSYEVTAGADTADSQVLEVLVKDKDMMKTKFMGVCSIDVSKLKMGETRKWYGLCAEGGESEDGLGKVELLITCSTLTNEQDADEAKEDDGEGGRHALLWRQCGCSTKTLLQRWCRLSCRALWRVAQ